jgi:hypothetical protein
MKFKIFLYIFLTITAMGLVAFLTGKLPSSKPSTPVLQSMILRLRDWMERK